MPPELEFQSPARPWDNSGETYRTRQGRRVYDSIPDALHELRMNFHERSLFGVYVTKGVYDSFDPMEHLDLAVFAEHGEPCGFVVDRCSYSRWDEERKTWVPFQWELSWCRPSKNVLRGLVSCAKAFYRRPVDLECAGKQAQITLNQEENR